MRYRVELEELLAFVDRLQSFEQRAEDRLVDNQGRVSYWYTGDNATVVLDDQGRGITGWVNNGAGTAGGAGG